MDERIDRTLTEIRHEAEVACSLYGDFTSMHEALGVLQEEFDELKAELRNNHLPAVRLEAIQVAAVATRLAEIAGRESPNPFSIRSGCE